MMKAENAKTIQFVILFCTQAHSKSEASIINERTSKANEEKINTKKNKTHNKSGGLSV